MQKYIFNFGHIIQPFLEELGIICKWYTLHADSYIVFTILHLNLPK